MYGGFDITIKYFDILYTQTSCLILSVCLVDFVCFLFSFSALMGFLCFCLLFSFCFIFFVFCLLLFGLFRVSRFCFLGGVSEFVWGFVLVLVSFVSYSSSGGSINNSRLIRVVVR